MAGAGDDPWFSVTNATHYVLDGVPMRVAENFRPKAQKKHTLPPLRFNTAQSKVLNAKYEFRTEHAYIQWHEAVLEQAEQSRQEKLRKQEEEAKREQEEKAAAKLAAANAASSSNASQPKPVAALEPLKPSLPNGPTVSSSILLPQRVSPLTVASCNQNKSQASGVNIKDFENLAEDPFDNLELKTINDMKELESVLANTQLSQANIGQNINQNSNTDIGKESPRTNADVANGSSENLYENPTDILSAGKDDVYQNMQSLQTPPADNTNSLRKKKGPLAAPRMAQKSVDLTTNNLNRISSAPSAQFNCQTEEVNIGATVQFEQKAKPPKPPPPTKPKPVTETKTKNLEKAAAGSVEKPVKPQSKIQSLANALSKDLANSMTRPPGAPKGFSYVPSSIGDSPVDDKKDVKDIEWPTLTPIPQADDTVSPFTYSTTTTPNVDAKKVNGISVPAPAAVASSNGAVGPKPARPAPPRPAAPSTSSPRSSASFETNSHVVNSLIGMGFDKAQITAAMKHIGSDTKKLIDHLCAVQKLTSSGVKWQSAEQAVMICGTDISKAEKFAKGYQQLLEFGFSDDKIKEALLGCDMDVQQALEQLL